MTIRKTVISVGFLFCSLIMAAQESNISPYSYFGIGDLQTGESGRTSGMASTAISLSGKAFVNTVNPAAPAFLDTCLFVLDVTGSARGSLLRTGTDSEKAFSANFSRISAGLHITRRWAAAFSVQPYSTVSYKTEVDEDIEGSTSTTTTVYEGAGGLTRMSLINSFALTRKLSIGADAMLLVGNIDREVTQSGITITNNSNTTSFVIKAGLLYKEKLAEHLNFSLGVTYSHTSKLIFDNEIIATNEDGDILMQDDQASSSLIIPSSIGAGISLTGKRLMVAADYRFQKWSQARERLSGYNFTDTHRFNGGISFIPSVSAATSYFDIMEYQAGFTISNSYLIVSNINPINWEITAGVGLPFRSGSQLNLGLAWGKTGTTANMLVREDYFRVTLGISMAERMFLKRMYD